MKGFGAHGPARRGCGRGRGITLALLALSVTLVACGQKGALYLPQKGKAVPAQSSGQRPATPGTPPSSQLPTMPRSTPESQAPAESSVPPPGQVPQTAPTAPVPVPPPASESPQPRDDSGS